MALGVDAYLLNLVTFGELEFVDIAWSEMGSDIAKMEVIEHRRSAREILQPFILFAKIDANVNGSRIPIR